MKTASELLQQFLRAYYTERSSAEAAAYLSDEVTLCRSNGQPLHGAAAVQHYLTERIATHPESISFSCSVLSQSLIAPTTSSVCLRLRLSGLVPEQWYFSAVSRDGALYALYCFPNETENTRQAILSRLSHEFRTPLNIITGMTSLAQTNRADSGHFSCYLGEIRHAADHLQQILNELLALSDAERYGITPELRPLLLQDFLAQQLQQTKQLAVAAGLLCDCTTQGIDAAPYMADVRLLRLVVRKLVENAVKFSAEGGKITLTCQGILQNSRTTRLHLVVSNTGSGIPSLFLEQLFRPFAQAEQTETATHEGCGLGLALVKHYVDAMDGAIGAQNLPEGGAAFWVDLPLTRAADARTLSGKRVLLAEDHPLNTMIATKLLERRKIQVEVAENGAKAVELFQKSYPGYYHAILMDIRMPIMDGWHAAAAIRALRRDDAHRIPIIAVTANALPEDRRRTSEVGMNAHLAKPFDPAQLYQTLAQQIDLAQMA